MRILSCGEAAWLVECANLDEAQRLSLAMHDVDGVEELVPAARTVLVRTHARSLSAVRDHLEHVELPAEVTARDAGEPITIDVTYDGDDLDHVGELTGLGSDGVIDAHTAIAWRVAFSGFAPGFGYLVPEDGSDTRLHVPRRDEPRTKVPKGAVGLAGEFTGCYPRSSPGGWQLIGRTDVALWDAAADPPALLVPGRRVRFEARS